MTTLLAIPLLIISPAFAGCWEPTTNTALGPIQTGAEEILVGDLVCELGSLENSTYRAACMDDAGQANFISVTESDNSAVVTWNEETPLTYRRCPTP